MYEFFKIKNPEKEEYSSGLKHGFLQTTKKGKTWNNIGHLKSHIKAVRVFNEKAFEYFDSWIILKITTNGVEQLGIVKDFK